MWFVQCSEVHCRKLENRHHYKDQGIEPAGQRASKGLRVVEVIHVHLTELCLIYHLEM